MNIIENNSNMNLNNKRDRFDNEDDYEKIKIELKVKYINDSYDSRDERGQEKRG